MKKNKDSMPKKFCNKEMDTKIQTIVLDLRRYPRLIRWKWREIPDPFVHACARACVHVYHVVIKSEVSKLSSLT